MSKDGTVSALNKYLKEVIALSRKDISSAVSSRNWFIQRVQTVIDSRKNEPTLYSENPFFVYGSYAKGTKVSDLDEFDVMVVIDSNGGSFSRGGNSIGIGLGKASPNPKYQAKFYKSDDSGVSPSKILNWLKGIVKEITDSFGGEAPERNGQAVTAVIKSKNLSIDLVPGGIFSRSSDGKIFYNIPKGDKDNSWIVTSPEDDIDLLERASKNRDNFKNIIRLGKRLKDKYNFLIPSFAIETSAIQYLIKKNQWYNHLYYDFVLFLSHLSDQLKEGIISDPFDSSVNLLDGVESVAWYAERVQAVIANLDNAETDSEDFATLYATVFDTMENQQ